MIAHALTAVARTRAPDARVRRCRGQAVTEFLVATAALVPLFAGVVVIGRLEDLRTHALQSSRYGAFARGFGASSVDVESEIRVRFFAEPDTPLVATDATRGGRADVQANAHWNDALRHPAAFIERPDDIVVAATEGAAPGTAARALDSAASAADRLSAIAGGRFDVERRGYHAVEVRARLAELPSLLTPAPLTLTATARVFGGDWSSSGPTQTAARATALAPATIIRRIAPVLRPLEWALVLLEPAFGDLCLGRVDAELVPADRLGAVGTGEPGTWVAPCP